MQDVKPVDYTVNSFNKMIQSKMIRKDNRGLMIQLKNIHDKLREDGTCWNRRDMTTPAVRASCGSISFRSMATSVTPCAASRPLTATSS